jgi:hypothetical protein
MSATRLSVNKKFHLLQCRTHVWESHPEMIGHYRIIFVLSGQGRFILDREMQSYSTQGIIFLKPGQHPLFQEDKCTQILMTAFDTFLSDDYQRKKALTPDFADIYKQAENLCNSPRLVQGQILSNERDAETISFLIDQICFEMAQRPASFVKLIQGYIGLIVKILERNNFEIKKAKEKQQQQTLSTSIIEYIREQLEQKKNVRIPEMLMLFNISEEAANLCTLNQTGMSLRNFIFKYKTDLFKSRMLKIDIAEFSPYLRNPS